MSSNVISLHTRPAPLAEIRVVMEGGVIQSIYGTPNVKVTVIDYDNDGVPDSELTWVQQTDGTLEAAIVTEHMTDDDNPKPGERDIEIMGACDDAI